jgi:hypothetical protein
MILNENLNVTYSEISSETKQILSIFQDTLKILLKFYHHNNHGDKRGQLKSIKEFKEMKKEFARFHNYPFMKPIFKQINKIQSEFLEMFQSKRSLKKIDYSDLRNKINAFKDGDWKSAKSIKPLIDTYQSSKKKPLEYKFNPFYIENPIIFQTNDFLKQFEKNDIIEVANKDLNKFKYSYIPLNDIIETDFQYLAYMILNLFDKPNTTTLSGRSLKSFFDMTILNKDYKNLILLINDYLYNNNKTLIPKIINLIKDIPEVSSANEEAKKSIKQLYRGYPYDDNYDTNEEFIATSKSSYVAKRFALQIGHLESEDNRRSEVGIIETYKVSPSDIILDTTIFGGIYGESEVIIKGNIKPSSRIKV